MCIISFSPSSPPTDLAVTTLNFTCDTRLTFFLARGTPAVLLLPALAIDLISGTSLQVRTKIGIVSFSAAPVTTGQVTKARQSSPLLSQGSRYPCNCIWVCLGMHCNQLTSAMFGISVSLKVHQAVSPVVFISTGIFHLQVLLCYLAHLPTKVGVFPTGYFLASFFPVYKCLEKTLGMELNEFITNASIGPRVKQLLIFKAIQYLGHVKNEVRASALAGVLLGHWRNT